MEIRLDSFFIFLIQLTALPVVILLLAYTLRRLLFSFLTFFPRKQANHPDIQSPDLFQLPDVLILVPCRDEEEMIPGLCQALAQLDYPAEKVCKVLIDDGSQDHTRAVMENWVKDRTGWQLQTIQQNSGKANALNVALAQFSFGEIVFIYDADHRPEPGSLRRAVKYFQDERVAGVSGRTLPSNPLVSPSAFYSTVESLVHQMVTMRAKDRLNLAPALLGSNCGYRRSSLATCGGFRNGALLEDTDLTLAFYQAGFKCRFAEDAVALHQVPITVTGYLKQHVRWGRGFNDALGNRSWALLRDSRIPVKLRIELFMFSTGYLDRIVLVGAGLLSFLSIIFNSTLQFLYGVLFFALVAPFIQIVLLFFEQNVSLSYWSRLPWVPVFFVLDIYAAGRSMVASLLNRPRVWIKTERARVR